MNSLIVQKSGGLGGRIRVPGDKSISHRALLLGALAEGKSHIRGFLSSGDCLATLGCLRALGIEVEMDGTDVAVHGQGLHGLHEPGEPLDCIRSGTTMRLLAGILAGQGFDSVLTGDPQLLRRPMRRVVEPLRQMGADIADTDGRAPLTIHGRPLHSANHTLAIASAQVKSALLLAGLYADGVTTVHEPGPARDHTERMLKAQIANSKSANRQIAATRQSDLPPLTFNNGVWCLDPALVGRLGPLDMAVPGDFSSAAFLLVAGVLVPGSEVVIEGTGVNPTRTGLLNVLREMGAKIEIENEREQGGEPVGDLVVRHAALQATKIHSDTIVRGDTVVRMIDEFPVLAVAATQAEGQTVVCNAKELRVKETDRIATVVEELRKLGADIEGLEDGFVVRGPTPLHGTVVDSHGDHRLAMALAVAGLIAEGETVVQGSECIPDSFPGFEDLVSILRVSYSV